jgi:hypothetical protein
MKKHNLDLFKKCSEKELEKNIDLFNQIEWNIISYSQKLSESFIEKYSHKLDWGWISIYQELSEKFIMKHLDKISVFWLMENKKISNNIKKEIKTLKDII